LRAVQAFVSLYPKSLLQSALQRAGLCGCRQLRGHEPVQAWCADVASVKAGHVHRQATQAEQQRSDLPASAKAKTQPERTQLQSALSLRQRCNLTSRHSDWENGGCAGDEFHLACVIIDETDQLRPYYRERPLVRMPRRWKAFVVATVRQLGFRQLRLGVTNRTAFGSGRSLQDCMVCQWCLRCCVPAHPAGL